MTRRNTDYIRSLTRAETKVLDEKAGRVVAVVSTEAKDRDGDIIRQTGWDLNNFMRNPVMLDSHRYGSIEAIIGRWDSMEVRGKRLIGEATYDIGQGVPAADRGFQLAAQGRSAYSVGFIPDMAKAKELNTSSDWWVNYEFDGQELLEVSQVSVPSNPDALQRMKGTHPVIDDIVDEMLAEVKTAPDPEAARITFRRILREELNDPEFLRALTESISTKVVGHSINIPEESNTNPIDFRALFRDVKQEVLRRG